MATSPFCLKREDMTFRTIYRNTLSKKVYVYLNEDNGTEHFYRFLLPMGMEQGEYEYWITDPDEPFVLNELDPRKSTIDGERIWIYDCGVARVGRVVRADVTSYYTNKTYEQYR